MSCQDRFALKQSLCTERAYQNLTVAVTPIGRNVWFNPTRSDLFCNAFPAHCFAEPAEVADAGFYRALKASAVVNGALLIAEGGFANV